MWNEHPRGSTSFARADGLDGIGGTWNLGFTDGRVVEWIPLGTGCSPPLLDDTRRFHEIFIDPCESYLLGGAKKLKMTKSMLKSEAFHCKSSVVDSDLGSFVPILNPQLQLRRMGDHCNPKGDQHRTDCHLSKRCSFKTK